MSDHIHKTIEDLVAKLATQEQAVRTTKQMVNQLLVMVGEDERYAIDDASSPQGLGSIRPDQFYGRPMATVVKEYLEMRRAAGKGASTFSEIYDAMKLGGYQFDTKTDEIAKSSLRSALIKNPAFHRLPNGHYGLTAWYPKAKKDKPDAENGGANGATAPADGATPAAPKPDEE